MTEKPILFSTDMVKAILAGRKTQTRRVVKPQPPYKGVGVWVDTQDPRRYHFKMPGPDWDADGILIKETISTPKYMRGDILYVRETLKRIEWADGIDGIAYAADGEPVWDITRPGRWVWKNKTLSSRFMPKSAARIFLKVKDVRVERLQDITENDAWKEGCVSLADKNGAVVIAAKGKFHALWESINGKKYPWEVNPWLWVIEFEVVK